MPFSPSRRSRRSAARRSGAALAILAALAAAPAAAQAADPAAAEAPARDPRPQAHAYTVVDGRTIPAPLGGATGDAERGRAIYADPALGGCRACHAAPGLPQAPIVPLALADRAPRPEPEVELPPALDDPEAAALEDEDGSDSDSRLAPETAAPPPERPAPEAVADGGEGEAAGDEGAGEGVDGPDPTGDGSGGLDAAAAALLPLPPGPDLDGVATRLEIGELRLLVINPRIARAGSRMPAYHTISLSQAALTPALRQPWLSAQEIEDVVAYLATLDGSAATGAAPASAEQEAAATPGGAAGTDAAAPAPEAPPAAPAPEAAPAAEAPADDAPAAEAPAETPAAQAPAGGGGPEAEAPTARETPAAPRPEAEAAPVEAGGADASADTAK
ncbi:c-type cytochrome [Albimonas pacifica]|uniref:Meckel syndrome type 1 protein n=1 Tax=Albimonas pacifica TaxID=1114924 RepID=A0A1I3GBF9_9RHOB|nr:c-type cytochrome [Albimonas pacifica]SFI20799.1 Meckel syndrome type 1 protein [Albimonas pacifica]